MDSSAAIRTVIVQLADDVCRALQTRPSVHTLAVIFHHRPRDANTDGFWLPIARLGDNVEIELWLDHYSGLRTPRVWIGFSSRSLEDLKRIESVARKADIGRVLLQRSTHNVSSRPPYRFNSPLKSHEFGHLVLEAYPQDKRHYLGIYFPYAWPLSEEDRAAIIRDSSNLVAVVAAAHQTLDLFENGAKRKTDVEEQFHKEMIALYARAGKEVGYWAKYFLRSVKHNGGVATAKRMLRPLRDGAAQKGLQALVDAGRPDLSVEALVLQRRFGTLFTKDELDEARRRIASFPSTIPRRAVAPELNFPETITEARVYTEGAVRRVIVNAYERDSKARAACISKYGSRCAVCRIDFEEVYGKVGKGFIHVHHKKPLAAMRREYQLDPLKDLIPVCPNCHAMLHTTDPPLA